MEKQKRIFYNWFPNPNEINPFHLINSENTPSWGEAKEAWWELCFAQDEWSYKIPDKITESDVAKWKAVYEKFCDIIERGIKEDHKGYYGERWL